MSETKDWEKRARKLWAEQYGETGLLRHGAQQVMLQLGREMVADAQTRWQEREADLARIAADARAEEIAIKLRYRSREEGNPAMHGYPYRCDAFAEAMGIARSTGAKPEAPKMIPVTPEAILAEVQAQRAIDEAAIRADERDKVAREMIERYERLNERLDALERRRMAREAVLEEALREMVTRYYEPPHPIEKGVVISEMLHLARRALDWRPA